METTENAPAVPATPTLDSVAQGHITTRRPLDLGKGREVVVELWHLAAIKAKHALPGNKEMDEERFRQLVQDVIDVRIGGGAPEAAKK